MKSNCLGALFLCLVVPAVPVVASDEGATLAWEKDLQVLTVMTTIKRATSKAPGSLRQQVDTLLEAAELARRDGELGEMRRLLSQANALISGVDWTPKAEFAASLVLRSQDTIHDPTGLYFATLSQQFPVDYQLAGSATVSASLQSGSVYGREATAASEPETVRELGEFALLSRDLIDTPFAFQADLNDVPAGEYRLKLEIRDESGVAGAVKKNVIIVPGLDRQRREITARVDGNEWRETTIASLLYPFDRARTINQGIRQPLRYDFMSGIARANGILRSLEKGVDVVWQATGDHERHYWLASANRFEPYRIYVPATWNPREKTPLVVALHGSFGNHNSIFRYDQRLKALADQYGWIVAAPSGYSHNSVYGSRGRVVLTDGRAPPARPVAIDAVVLPADDYQPSPAEEAVLKVVELMKAEYAIDPDRVYLTGSSMGGEGVWHLGAKYPSVWAAIAPVAASIHPDDYDVRDLGDLPVLAVHGDSDPITSWKASADTIDRLNAAGGHGELYIIEGGGHGVWGEALGRIFAFFAAQAPGEGVVTTNND